MYLGFFDAMIDLSFIVMPLIVGLVAGFGASLPFLVCALFLAGAGLLFRLKRERITMGTFRVAERGLGAAYKGRKRGTFVPINRLEPTCETRYNVPC